MAIRFTDAVKETFFRHADGGLVFGFRCGFDAKTEETKYGRATFPTAPEEDTAESLLAMLDADEELPVKVALPKSIADDESHYFQRRTKGMTYGEFATFLRAEIFRTARAAARNANAAD